MKNIRSFAILLVISVLCVTALSSCTDVEENSSTDSVGADTSALDNNDSEISGYQWQLSGGAVYNDGVLVCPDGSRAVCNDKSLPNTFSVECVISTSSSAWSGIAINDVEETGHYILQLNDAKDTVILHKFVGEEMSITASANFDLDKNKMYRVKLAVNNASVKIFIAEESCEFPSYQIIDVMIEKYRPSTISFVSGSGNLTVKNINLGEYDMALTVNGSYINPVATGADPFVLYHDGTYYLYSTNAPSTGYKVSVSKNMKTWTDKGYCLVASDVYGTPTSSAGFWAPEVYHYNGQFYMIYTVNEHIGIAVSDSPLGPFKSPKQSFINNDKKEIDGHLFFDDDGKVYIYFVRCGSDVGPGRGNEIFGAEFDMETYTYKNERCLIYPERNTWEWIGDHGYVAEGPAVLKHEGRYYLTYSANGYTSQNYAIGLAICDSPLGNYNKYANNPILKKSTANYVYGPGHHGFTISPDGTELFIVYHRHASASTVHSRTTCIDRCYFVYDQTLGYDVLKVVGPTSTLQPLPSGSN